MDLSVKNRFLCRADTSFTIDVFACMPVDPGLITVFKTSNTGYEDCVIIGTPTAFVEDSPPYPLYGYKCTFRVSANPTGWPLGEDQVVTLEIRHGGVLCIREYEVFLVADPFYTIGPSVALRSS
jgi:hypothetical protein